MGKSYTTLKFFEHYLQSKRWDAFHSPFLFSLFTACCNEKHREQDFYDIEALRRKLKSSREVISPVDLGAGSFRSGQTHKKTIGKIARDALSYSFQGRFLYRMAQFVQPSRMVELGTSLGITTAYMALGAKNAVIDSVEGDPAIASKASEVFKELGINNVTIHQEPFSQFLERGFASTPEPGIIFIDGHHTGAAVQSYYLSILPFVHERTILVIDDIYWWADMQQGWQTLKDRPEVTQSVDCFHFGLLFFSSDFKCREHHITRLPLRMQLS